MFTSVTGVSESEPRFYLYWPVDQQWQERVAGLFGADRPSHNPYPKTTAGKIMSNRHPQRLQNVDGDGACLPRTISLAIFGDEEHHQLLRDAVVDFILQGPLPGETAPRDEAFFQRMGKMRLQTTWMTTFEVTAFGHMLDTPIFSCVEQLKADGSPSGKFFWQRLPHETSTHNLANGRGIYIFNSKNHFQLVLNP